MISKCISTGSFKNTCRYITQKPGATIILSEGVRSYDYKLMAKDFEMQQQLRPEKQQACFHGVLSFYPGEKPSDEMMEAIVKKYLQDLKIENTQYAVCKHADKAHLHLHIVANLVNNNGQAIKDSWIGLKGKKIAQRLTQEYKLIPALEKKLSLTHLDELRQPELDKYRVYQHITEILPQCRSMAELEKKLLQRGIEVQYKYKGQTQEKQGISFKTGNYCFKGSQVDRKFSYTGLVNTIQLKVTETLQQQQKQAQLLLQTQEKKREKSIGQEQKNELKPTSKIAKEPTRKQNNKPAKLIDAVIKPDLTYDYVPAELLKETEESRKRKRGMRISH
ncbi:relaxase/mobilization nuclease domain-containing protein [Ferruginibacter paludis]|uniref:relaxase/mobilization nuclease domain-containing protein n=1 Tax=Ferruginibacter paludis TaxID=1310417 RepID=UPI0025B5782C|nr:relaxase/mobilization nuclease domain-containing protein [Ferruginibacter paludis]MDN3657068.1 relaxase/mobilization nuclease domain-containing protein [Ferruginibacter paludis]